MTIISFKTATATSGKTCKHNPTFHMQWQRSDRDGVNFTNRTHPRKYTHHGVSRHRSVVVARNATALLPTPTELCRRTSRWEEKFWVVCWRNPLFCLLFHFCSFWLVMCRLKFILKNLIETKGRDFSPYMLCFFNNCSTYQVLGRLNYCKRLSLYAIFSLDSFDFSCNF